MRSARYSERIRIGGQTALGAAIWSHLGPVVPGPAAEHDRQTALLGRGFSKGTNTAGVMNVGNAHRACAALACQPQRLLCRKAHSRNAKALPPQHQRRAALSRGQVRFARRREARRFGIIGILGQAENAMGIDPTKICIYQMLSHLNCDGRTASDAGQEAASELGESIGRKTMISFKHGGTRGFNFDALCCTEFKQNHTDIS